MPPPIQRRTFLALAAASLSPVTGLALAQSKVKVAAIYTVPFTQQWVSPIHKALKAAAARGEIQYSATANVANSDYEGVMRERAAHGNQLIVGEAFAIEAAARKVAKDFPEVSFLMGSSGRRQSPNFSVFDNCIHEPTYLTGMIAGGMSKSNRIGLVGGFAIPEVKHLMNAFMAGTRETNPGAEFTVGFINSWFDPPKAREAALAMIGQGADVIYAERFGASDATREKGKLAIGNAINTQGVYPDTVVASALWNMEPSIDRALKLLRQGEFIAEDYGPYSMMKYGGSELAPLGTFTGRIPLEIIARVRAMERAIIDGKFIVPTSSPERILNA